MAMTYRELIQKLQSLSKEQLDMHVSLLVWDEFHEVREINCLSLEDGNDTLDVNHPIIIAR